MPDVDHAHEAQRAAEARLEELERCLLLELDGEDPDAIPWPEDMQAPYDGCSTCQVRETLAAAYPHLERLIRED